MTQHRRVPGARKAVRANLALARTQTAAGLPQEANSAAEAALKDAMALEDQWLLGKALLAAATTLLELARPLEALPLAEEAEQLFAAARRAAAKALRLQATRLAARCLAEAGRGPQALARYEFAIAEFAELPAPRTWRWTTEHAEARAATVPLLREAGRVAEAVEEAISSINFWSRHRHPRAARWRCSLYYELARGLETIGELEEAAEAAEMGIAETSRLGTHPDRVALLQTLRGSILVVLGEVTRGGELLAQAAAGAAPSESLARLVENYAARPQAPEALAEWARKLREVPRPVAGGQSVADQDTLPETSGES